MKMKIEIAQKNYVIKERLQDLIEKKVKKLDKYFEKNANCKVVCSQSKDKLRNKMEITIASSGRFIRSEVETDNMYANLDICLARIEKQLVKLKGKQATKNKKAVALKTLEMPDFAFLDEAPVFAKPKIVKTKRYELTSITPEEAIDEMELIGNTFYVFRNAKTGDVNIVYARREGGYGLIETI